ncbi:hypothetical protein [Actinokineospora iranica]|uniref:Uncharacterized protein n=1 Tax=Actinokineospora iranica TaxID=1271860 RepID=A0A1G6JN70_9PSEU|nr:hypothetical protein [Actinokineospora iranica]SDC20137.1 hypothetical protein SAMN05216174_101485 [Actinokineospora iranica]
MATPPHRDNLVPRLYRTARASDITAPERPPGRTPPRQSELDDIQYRLLLDERATNTSFVESADSVGLTRTAPTTLALWRGSYYIATRHALDGDYPFPAGPPHAPQGATGFTRRGDHRSTGWLSAYNELP